MFELRVAYPTKEEEETIVEATTGDAATEIAQVLTAEDVLTLQHLVRRIPVPKPLVRAAVTLVRMSRPGDGEAPAFIKEFVSWGAGPRASQYLILGAKARGAGRAAHAGRGRSPGRGAHGAHAQARDQFRGGGGGAERAGRGGGAACD